MKTGTSRALWVGGGLAVVGGLFLLGREAKADGGGGGGGDPRPGRDDPDGGVWDPAKGAETINLVRELQTLWDIEDPLADFLLATFRGESGLDPRIMNGVALPPSSGLVAGIHRGNKSDTRGATAAYKRVGHRFASCSHSAGDYTAGSYGLGNMLPVYFAEAWRRRGLCVHPLEAFRVGPHLISAIHFLHRTEQNYSAFDGTFGVARVGWAMPSRMDEPGSVAYIRATTKLRAQLSALFGPKYDLASKLPSLSRYDGAWAEQALKDWWDLYPAARVR